MLRRVKHSTIEVVAPKEEDNGNVSYRNRIEGCGLDSSGSGESPAATSSVHVKERSGSTKRRKFLKLLK
jgi:hypothetical protein